MAILDPTYWFATICVIGLVVVGVVYAIQGAARTAKRAATSIGRNADTIIASIAIWIAVIGLYALLAAATYR